MLTVWMQKHNISKYIIKCNLYLLLLHLRQWESSIKNPSYKAQEWFSITGIESYFIWQTHPKPYHF